VTTPYAILEDPLNPSGAIDFYMDGNFQNVVHEVGALYYPLGYGYAVKSTDGTKGMGGILLVTTTSDVQEAACKVLMQTVTKLVLTLPNGLSYNIMWDPAQDKKSTAQFSLLLWQPIVNWTAYFVQIP
jgi:hypothetical protein